MRKDRNQEEGEYGLEQRFDPKHYDYTCIFQFNGQSDLSPYVHLSAKGICPTIRISHHIINFGECNVNERKDFVVTLENKNEEQAVDFSFSTVSSIIFFLIQLKNFSLFK